MDDLPDVVPALVREKRLCELIHELDTIRVLVEALLEKGAKKRVERALAVLAGAVEESAPLGFASELEGR